MSLPARTRRTSRRAFKEIRGVMGDLFSILLFAGVTIFLVRRLFSAPLAVNRAGIRLLFLQQLQALCPEMRLLEEKADQLAVHIGTQICIFHLEYLYRRCAELPAQAGPLIRQAIVGVDAALHGEGKLPPDWEQRIIPLLFRADASPPAGLRTAQVTDDLSLGYAVRGEATFTWVTEHLLPPAQLSDDALHTLALRNLERSCSSLVIETPGVQADGQEHYLRFITGDGLDAARLLIPSLHGRFSTRFDGDDLLVAIPTRDTLVMIGARDGAIANFLAYRGLWEYARRAYPITERLFLVTERGLRAWPVPAGATHEEQSLGLAPP